MSELHDLGADWPAMSTPMPTSLPDEEAGPGTPTPAARLGGVGALDGGVERLHQVADAIPPGARDLLGGGWLGHPLHPVLTDLAIGFWTSAWVLDIVGGRRSARAATAFVALGVASAAPTAAAGIVDWSQMDDRAKQRVGVVHAAANVTATALYAASFVQRCRGRRGRGVLLGMAGAAAATAGGYLGGHLVFGES